MMIVNLWFVGECGPSYDFWQLISAVQAQPVFPGRLDQLEDHDAGPCRVTGRLLKVWPMADGWHGLSIGLVVRMCRQCLAGKS